MRQKKKFLTSVLVAAMMASATSSCKARKANSGVKADDDDAVYEDWKLEYQLLGDRARTVAELKAAEDAGTYSSWVRIDDKGKKRRIGHFTYHKLKDPRSGLNTVVFVERMVYPEGAGPQIVKNLFERDLPKTIEYMIAAVPQSDTRLTEHMVQQGLVRLFDLKQFHKGVPEAVDIYLYTKPGSIAFPPEVVKTTLLSAAELGDTLGPGTGQGAKDALENNTRRSTTDREQLKNQPNPKPIPEFEGKYINLTNQVNQGLPPYEVVDTAGIEAIRTSLQKHEIGSVVILGEAGSGKTTMVKSFVYEMNQGKFPEIAPGTQIYQIEAASLNAGTKYRGEFETKMAEIKKIASKTPLILFIDEIHTLSGAGTSEGNDTDFFEYIKEELADGRIRILATSTVGEFDAAFIKRTAVYGRFERYNKPDPTRDQLVASVNGWNRRFGYPEMPAELADKIVEYATRYNGIGSGLRKVSGLLDSYYAKQAMEPDQPVDLHQLVLAKYNLTPEALDPKKQTEKIANLVTNLKAKIKGQEALIEGFRNLALQSFVRLETDKGPNSIILAGPRGAGKTSSCKAYADYMGVPFVMIEMARYSSGSNLTSEDLMRELASAIRNNSTSFILLDEIEKARMDVQNALLTAMNEGFFFIKETSGSSTKVDFRNPTVAFTTNAGQEYVAAGKTDPVGLKNAIARGGMSEFLVDRIQVAAAIQPVQNKEDFKAILVSKYEDTMKALKRSADNSNVTIDDHVRDEIINNLVEKYAASSSTRDAIAELTSSVKITVAMKKLGLTKSDDPCAELLIKHEMGE